MNDLSVRTLNGDLSAVVRTFDGIFDCRRTEGVWVCSCGKPTSCTHVAKVELALDPAMAEPPT